MDTDLSDLDIKREGKICSVCGDSALGYNFNAVTCESCKAFFRRNALKHKEFRCPFKESCQITSVTRRFCQKCRLEKCFSVGMKRELILSDEQKERKKRKKIEKLPQQEQKVTSTEVKQTCDISIQTENVPCACSAYGHSSISLGVYDLRCNACIGSFSSDEVTPTPLSTGDKIILNDIVTATKALDAPIDQEMSNFIGDEFKSFGSKSLLDVINLTAIAIRRLIKMCKSVWGFRTLSQCDQLSLLKQGCTQMMLLRSVMNFDPVKNSWKIPHSVEEMSRIKLEVLKETRGNLYEAHEAWLKSFDHRASHDLRVICLLQAIALFDPTRSRLSDTETIKFIQIRYYEILRRYLESLYRISEAHEIYTNLIEKITELRGLNEEYVRVYLNVDPAQVEPLLIEIFDLNTR